MNGELILKIADYLENNVAEDDFDMDFWKKEGPECGTAGCAIGHTYHLIPGMCMVPARYATKKHYLMPMLDGLEEIEAVAHGLSINYRQAESLFLARHYDLNHTKEDVINRLRNFVKSKEVIGKEVWCIMDNEIIKSNITAISQDSKLNIIGYYTGCGDYYYLVSDVYFNEVDATKQKLERVTENIKHHEKYLEHMKSEYNKYESRLKELENV